MSKDVNFSGRLQSRADVTLKNWEVRFETWTIWWIGKKIQWQWVFLWTQIREGQCHWNLLKNCLSILEVELELVLEQSLFKGKSFEIKYDGAIFSPERTPEMWITAYRSVTWNQSLRFSLGCDCAVNVSLVSLLAFVSCVSLWEMYPVCNALVIFLSHNAPKTSLKKVLTEFNNTLHFLPDFELQRA